MEKQIERRRQELLTEMDTSHTLEPNTQGGNITALYVRPLSFFFSLHNIHGSFAMDLFFTSDKR